MALFRVTWDISYNQGGYSFSHYRNDAGYDTALGEAEQLLVKYMALLGGQVYCKNIRVSDITIPGDSVVNDRIFASIANGFPVADADQTVKTAVSDGPDLWWTAALLRLGAGPGMVGHQFVRLIPDQLTQAAFGGTAGQIEWDKALLKYFQQLIAGQWGLRAIPRSATLRKAITSIGIAVAEKRPITTAAPHGLAVGAKFRIGGFRGASGTNVNGDYLVEEVVDANTLRIRDQADFAIAFPVTNWGSLWPTEKTFGAYVATQCRFRRFTKRNTGRPFGVLVGRRSIRT